MVAPDPSENVGVAADAGADNYGADIGGPQRRTHK